MKVRFSITVRQRQSLRNLIEAIPEDAWTPIPYWMEGAADVAEAEYTPFRNESDATPVRLIVRRVKPTPRSQLALFTTYSYHAFITDREGQTLNLEADHRRHAEIENAIRDLKYGVGLNHLPSGRFPANGAWLAVHVIAHNFRAIAFSKTMGVGEPDSVPAQRQPPSILAGRDVFNLSNRKFRRWLLPPNENAIALPTIWHAGQRPSVWVSNWRPPRPSGGDSSPWPDASAYICHGVGPGKTSSAAPLPDCGHCHSLPDGGVAL